VLRVQLREELSGVARHDEVSSDSADASPAVRPMRADAQRNRDKLLRVAAEAFTEVGVEVPLEEIARRAGVGIGTFYRHFPTREALVVAVYRQLIDDLAAAARELPLVHPPAEALREWMHAFVDYAAVKRGMVALLKSMMETDSQLFDDARATLHAAAGSLMTSAAQAGAIRPDVGPAELIRAIGGICMATDRPGSEETAIALVDLVFDGLRYGARVHP
jgi:AcrR family transcriptional regulator